MISGFVPSVIRRSRPDSEPVAVGPQHYTRASGQGARKSGPVGECDIFQRRM